jgi:hypothetical protein
MDIRNYLRSDMTFFGICISNYLEQLTAINWSLWDVNCTKQMYKHIFGFYVNQLKPSDQNWMWKNKYIKYIYLPTVH